MKHNSKLLSSVIIIIKNSSEALFLYFVQTIQEVLVFVDTGLSVSSYQKVISSLKNWDKIRTVLLSGATAPIPFHRDVA